MTYIVNDKCIKCKLTDCVDVCPVDCFYEGKNMLVIKPDECIDCGVCEPECPVDAIKADTEPGSEQWLEINKKYSEIWPNISEKKDPPTDHENFKNEQNKYEKYFLLISNHCSLPGSVSALMASTGHSGSQTPQSIHSSGLITSIFFPS